ncbi:MAG TPA: hypothetical protein VFD42_08045 [Chloroflexota bacterium]|nr:hypothetical protein [Chloroflexota bacterium]
MKSRRLLQVFGVSLVASALFAAACAPAATPTPTAAPKAAATTAPLAAPTKAPAAAPSTAPTVAPTKPAATAPAATAATAPAAAAAPAIPHPLEGMDNCVSCHQAGGAGVATKGGTGMPANHSAFTITQCSGCHKAA